MTATHVRSIAWAGGVGLVALILLGVGAWLMTDGSPARAAFMQAAALTGGDPERGRTLIDERGCGGCHTIPGVPHATGLVGPSLERIGSRVYIAGVLANNPGNMVRWLRDPPGVDPLTAMPRLGLGERESRDIAAYIYSLR